VTGDSLSFVRSAELEACGHGLSEQVASSTVERCAPAASSGAAMPPLLSSGASGCACGAGTAPCPPAAYGLMMGSHTCEKRDGMVSLTVCRYSFVYTSQHRYSSSSFHTACREEGAARCRARATCTFWARTMRGASVDEALNTT